MKQTFTTYALGVAAFLTLAGTATAVASFFNGFETDTSGWNDYAGSTVTRVASGNNGVTSADGDYHAVLGEGALVTGGVFDGKRFGPYTYWGGAENTFPTDGYVTKVDVYLDMSLADGSDQRFDFSSAINQPDGNHRRDFIFSAGTDPLTPGQWAVSVSNNAPGWPSNPGRDPLFVDQTGWYTFQSTFKDNGAGVLEVEMSILNSNEDVLKSWTLSDPTDVIGVTVGGNRYGWFVTNDFDELAIDNSEKYNIVPLVGPPTAKDQCKHGGWMDFNNPTFKNQGDCVSYTQSSEHAKGNKNK